MTNREKAIDLLDKDLGTKNMSNGGFGLYKLQCHYIHLLCEMAAWKEQQLIEKAAKWLKENAGMYWYDDIYIDCPAELLEDFKNAMKEE